MILCTWNVRGINHPFKQKEVILFLKNHNIDVFGYLEIKIKKRKAKMVLLKIFISVAITHIVKMAEYG